MVNISFSGQSNAQLPSSVSGSTFQTRTAPQAPGPPPNSYDHVLRNVANPLTYPIDRPKHYMNFALKKYSRDNLLTVGILSDTGVGPIIMPLSESMLDGLQVKWQEAPVGMLLGGGHTLFGGAGSAAKTMKEIKQASVRFGEEGPTARDLSAIGLMGMAGLGAGQSEGANLISTLQGLSPNQFMTMLFVGPEYKRHQMSWNLSPRNPEESNILKDIIHAFKVAMSPTIEYGVLWGYPNIFDISIMVDDHENFYMYRFKPSVLESFSVHYSPGGRTAFFHTTTGTPLGGAPEGVTIRAQFIELEYWIRLNKDSNEFRDGGW
jgi:hypothetical protein